MKKVIIIPDSFKGTLSSREVIEVISQSCEGLLDVTGIPVADGGEGTVEAFITACGGSMRNVMVHGPFMQEMKSFYGVINDRTAVIELAAAAGLPLAEGRKDPLKATTYGVGELILDAVENGYDDIIIGLGGSCSNDGGCGIACALGYEFRNEKGESFLPTGGTLKDICYIDSSKLKIDLDKIHVTVMCDVDNPLYGRNGAAYVFAPQKGADKKEVILLDQGLKHLSSQIRKHLHTSVWNIPGSGAAGGCGGGLMAFVNGELKAGIDTVLEKTGFNDKVRECDCIITGEGKLDEQSFHGKVISGVLKHSQGKPVIAVVGMMEGNKEDHLNRGLSDVFACIKEGEEKPADRQQAVGNLIKAADRAVKSILRV